MIRFSKKIWLFGLPAILLVGFAVLSVSYIRQRAELLEQKRALEAQTENACHALANDLKDLEIALSKLEAASTPARLSKTFSDVKRLSAGAVRALSLLPVSCGDDEGLMQFLTRAGDYADTLMDRVLNGQMLTEEQRASLSDLRACCADLAQTYDGDVTRGSFPKADGEFYAGATEKESIPDYPSLLYDGPFSESSETAKPQGLPSETIGEAEATRIAAEWFPDRALTFDGRTEGTIVTYDFSADDGAFCASVTEQGGELLYFMGAPKGAKNDPPGDAESERLHRAASSFLQAHGFGEMAPSYAQYYAGTTVINYAAVQDGVILYADLVKVYVDRETEEVIGLDTQNYRCHHRPRHVQAPALSEQDAVDRVSDALTIEQVRLALIPKCNTREVLCYECKCTLGETFFIVYINALNGAEEELFEVINSNEGDLVV